MKSVFLENAVTIHDDPDFTINRFLKRIEMYGEHAGLILKKIHPEYFRSNIFTKYLEPLNFKQDNFKVLINKIILRILSGFPLGAISEYFTTKYDKNGIIKIPGKLYGISVARHYLTGVRKRNAG